MKPHRRLSSQHAEYEHEKFNVFLKVLRLSIEEQEVVMALMFLHRK